MQTPEEFMRKYFRERTDVIRAEISRRQPFRQKFYFEDCAFDNRKGAIAQSEAEQILSVTSFEEGTEVITTGIGTEQRTWRLRYQLQAIGDHWLIKRVQMECGICHGTGKRKQGTVDCPICKGKGWT